MKTREKQQLKSRFPLSLFVLYLMILLLMSGIHTGLITLGNKHGWNGVIQTIIPSAYWTFVAVLLTVFTRRQITKTYDQPMKNLAQATRKVAQGDFSVYVPTIHPADRLDYLDYMILDFNTMVAELGSIETMRIDFISNVSHEIKAPLAVISNYAQLLRDQTLSPEEQQKNLDEITRNVHRLADLVTNILKLNKIKNQVIKPDAAPYDLCAQLAECALLFENSWEEKQIQFEFDTEDRAEICADREMMALVWNNLLSNAIKFTPEGGTVALKQTSEEHSVTVAISDTGCGMSQETMARIFEKFYQGDTSHAAAGNGLGLALVRRILEISGGTVTVSSELGEGSVFTVRLPAGGTTV